MRPQVIVKHLPVKMTGEEKLLKSEQSVAITQEEMELEEELKQVSSDLKTKIKEKQKIRLAFHRELRSGEEIRPIECIEVFRFEQDMVELVRNDTGETVERRAMDPRDKQAHLSLGDLEVERDRRRSKRGGLKKGDLTVIDGSSTQDPEGGDQGPEETH